MPTLTRPRDPRPAWLAQRYPQCPGCKQTNVRDRHRAEAVRHLECHDCGTIFAVPYAVTGDESARSRLRH